MAAGRARTVAILVWLAFVAACVVVALNSRYSADLSAFLPRSPSPQQRLLVEQIKSGLASRLILVAIEGGKSEDRIRLSHELAARLRGDPAFDYLANGENNALARDREILLDNRYALSPAADAQRYRVAGLRAGIEDSLDLLTSSAGMMVKPLLNRDPTGEFMQLLDRLDSGQRPHSAGGVWVALNGQRAILMARTHADGADTDGQEAAIHALRSHFAALKTDGARLLLSGPGVFSVEARATIKGQISRISALGMALIVSLLLLVYRSPRVLLLSLLPVLSGALAGVAAVSLGFGLVHGVTLGFGTALIGESLDYAIYLLMQTGGTRVASNFWPTILIGVLTSVFGFASLLASGFPGLAQLGAYAIAGLVVAASVTRWLLPHLLPADLAIRDLTPLGLRLADLAASARRGRWLLAPLGIAAVAILATHHDPIWNRELAALSPISPAQMQLDTQLRSELGAPDMSTLLLVDAPSREAALAASEQLAARLDGLVEAGVLAGYESPANYLASVATQTRRLAAIPPLVELRRHFAEALVGLPLRGDCCAAFFNELEAARTRPPLTRADLDGSSLAQAVDALMFQSDGVWHAMLPLRAPATGVLTTPLDAAPLAAALNGLEQVHRIDLKTESDRLYAGYLDDAIRLSLYGLLAIVLLLGLALRSWLQMARVVAPLLLAVLVVTAGLVLAGRQLILLHLVGMLLTVAVGSNYALFFAGAEQRPLSPRLLASLLVATCSTVIGFGLLGFSSLPVLQAIGVTVGPGAILSLVFSAMLAKSLQVSAEPAP
jgi:predicted exporter